MNHLKMLGHIDIAWVLPALTQHSALWDEETWRQNHPHSPHKSTRAIYLRMPPEVTVDSIFNSLEVVDCPAMQIRPFAALAAHMAAEIDAGERVARLMLIELAPHSRIRTHKDEGAYAEATERYHLPLITNRDCLVQILEESAHMEPGDIWWFNKHEAHSVTNFGTEARVHMVMDVFRT